MEKSADAFRTISEVADHLETPAHVLRFWESRFPQIKPVKRAGGRRYYRPTDVALLAGIRRLLHDEGMTIRGVQKILREQGVRHVAGLSDIDISDAIEAPFDADDGAEAPVAAQVVSLSDWVSAEKAVESPAPTPAEDAEPILQQGFKFDAQDDASEGFFILSSSTTIEAVFEAATVDDLTEGHDISDAQSVEFNNRAQDGAAVGMASPAAESDIAEHLPAEDTPEGPDAESVLDDPDVHDAVPAQAFPPATEEKPDPRNADDAVWLPALLRGLSPAMRDRQRDALRPLHARLSALRDRMAEAGRASRP